MVRSRILLVDDDPAIRFSVGDFLGSLGYEVDEAGSLDEAKRMLRQTRPDLVLLDHILPDGGAVNSISDLLQIDSAVVIIVLTGHGSIDLAVKAVKQGADQFLTKPIQLDSLKEVLERSLENRRLRRKIAVAEQRETRDELDPFLGSSDEIRRLEKEAGATLSSDSPVLIQGETGSGKGVLARWLHARGARAAEPFVDVNCAGLTRELLDSELFGHARGAFTGAVQEKQGLLELAHKGVLFMDEIGDMSLPIQGKLLKVLEEKRFRRLGETTERRVDLKIIVATHRDLARLRADGSFRSDLYYRISALRLRVPALRERREDLDRIIHNLLRRLNAEMNSHAVLTDAALDRLRSHSWPGNFRELRNVLERAVLSSGGGSLGVDDLHFDPPPRPANDSSRGTLEELENEEIRRTLVETRGNVSQASDRLGMPRSTLYVKLKELQIDPADYR